MCILCVSKEAKRQPYRPTREISSEDFRTGSCHLTKPIWRQRILERLAGETENGFGRTLGRATERSFLPPTRKGATAG